VCGHDQEKIITEVFYCDVLDMTPCLLVEIYRFYRKGFLYLRDWNGYYDSTWFSSLPSGKYGNTTLCRYLFIFHHFHWSYWQAVLRRL